MNQEFRSRVYTDRPDYADFEPAAKFEAIKSIIAKRLREHPNAICSYSGGSDSDIMIDVIERTREVFDLPPVDYVFFNTGLEMKATKDHVKATEEKYHIDDAMRDKSKSILMILEHEDKQVCVFADRLIGEQEIVVKPIPTYIKKVEGISGCTQLGDGSLALIIDVGGLIQTEERS